MGVDREVAALELVEGHLDDRLRRSALEIVERIGDRAELRAEPSWICTGCGTSGGLDSSIVTVVSATPVGVSVTVPV